MREVKIDCGVFSRAVFEPVDIFFGLDMAQKKSEKLSRNNWMNGSDCSAEEDMILAVLDFESTCDKNSSLTPQEIIEFPVVLVNATKQTIISKFHSYCKPIIHPILTPFCTQLTGITQSQVDSAPKFPDVLKSFNQWLEEQKIEPDEIALVTCGDWDLGTMLPQMCSLHKIKKIPTIFHQWIDLKAIFKNAYHTKKKPSFKEMMEYLVLPIKGKHHCGIDDAVNMTSIIFQMNKNGLLDKFEITSSLS